MTSAFDVPTSGAPDPFVDVWSRTSPHHRRQAIGMLLLLAMLFACLCCFTFWLRTGHYLPMFYDGYVALMQKSFDPTGPNQITLSHFLTYPISVQRVPIHAITMGLLFASLCSIPILVSILYRFPYSIIFAAMVVFLAAMPWLGLTVLMGCAIASLKPFRLSFRYASALLGLVPIAIYFFSASREPAGAVLSPDVNRALRYAPWFLSLLGSCVICALALGVARLINYRPGGIPPILAVLFAVPVILFHAKVGRDELEYHLLEHQIGPGGDVVFVNQDIGAMADQRTTRLWSESRNRPYEDIRSDVLAHLIKSALDQAETDRLTAAARCDNFITHFSQSRYVPNVLYLKGRALDQRLRRQRLERDLKAEYQSEQPSPRSRSTWETLVANYPGHELTIAAYYRLAILHAREGEFSEALRLLNRATQPLSEPVDTTEDGKGPGAALRVYLDRSVDRGERLGVDRTSIILRSRRLAEMITACRNDAPRPLSDVFLTADVDATREVHPLQLLISFYVDDPRYEENLAAIPKVFPQSETRYYADIRAAALIAAMSRRIDRMRTIVQQTENHPAHPEAMFRLAEALQDDSIADECEHTLEELTKLHPQSVWAQEARERLMSVTILKDGNDTRRPQ